VLLYLPIVPSSYLHAYEDGTDSVPKSWHLDYSRRGITQKKAYDIQNKAKVLNQENVITFLFYKSVMFLYSKLHYLKVYYFCKL
jgi:hypothetical protein